MGKFTKHTRAKLRAMGPQLLREENATLKVLVQEQRQQIADLTKLVKHQRRLLEQQK